MFSPTSLARVWVTTGLKSSMKIWDTGITELRLPVHPGLQEGPLHGSLGRKTKRFYDSLHLLGIGSFR